MSSIYSVLVCNLRFFFYYYNLHFHFEMRTAMRFDFLEHFSRDRLRSSVKCLCNMTDGPKSIH